jgi:hypothetical protein
MFSTRKRHPMNERATILYQHVLKGLSEDWSQIEALDKTFSTIVSDTRRVERDTGAGALPGDWDRDWHRIEALLGEIRDHAAKARKRIGEPAASANDPSLEWEPVAALEDELDALLEKRKAAGAALVTPGTRMEWEACWLTLESYSTTLRAHARSVQVKLELRRKFGEAQAAEIAAELAAKLPEDLRDRQGAVAFQTAVEQLQTERQQFRGVWDVIKALALWVEAPEERARKIREGK